MSRRVVANPLALAILACLWERPMYPYEITSTLRSRGKEDSIRLNFGSLYSVIKSLEKHGFIAAQHTEREGNRPERVVYAITDEGRTETDEWLRELLSDPVKEYPAIETGLSLLPLLPPADVATLLRRRVSLLDREMAARRTTLERSEAAQLPELLLIEFTFKMSMLRAERDFIADLAGRIEDGSFGGSSVWTTMHELLASGQSPAEVQEKLKTYLESEETTFPDWPGTEK